MKDYTKFIKTVRGYLNGTTSKEQVWYELGRIDAESDTKPEAFELTNLKVRGGDGKINTAEFSDGCIIIKSDTQPRYADWSQAPDWAKWHAIDAGGMGYFFENHPKKLSDCLWVIVTGAATVNTRFDITNIDWTKTLEARP